MERKRKKVVMMMNILMGVSMSFMLSFVGTLMGGHFSIPSWAMSFGISLVISLIIGFVIPMKKAGDAVCKLCKATPESFPGHLISSAVSDLVYTPLITVIMVSIMLTTAAKHAPTGAVPPISKVLPGSLLVCLVLGYVIILIIQPIFLRILVKNIMGGKPE